MPRRVPGLNDETGVRTVSTAAAPAPVADDQKGTRPFGLRDKIGYMFGDFGNDFSFILQSTFFLIFYSSSP